jgi:hypothetical protein
MEVRKVTEPVRLQVTLERVTLKGRRSFARVRLYKTSAPWGEVPVTDMYVRRHAIDALGSPRRIRFTLEAAAEGAETIVIPGKLRVVLDREKAFQRGFRYATDASEDIIPFRNAYVFQHAIDALGDPDQILVTLDVP